MSWNLNVLGGMSSGSLWWSGCLQTKKFTLLQLLHCWSGVIWVCTGNRDLWLRRGLMSLHHLHFLGDFRSDSWQLMTCEVHREENIYVIIFVGKWIKAVGSCPKEIWDLNQILWVVKWGGNQAPISLFTINLCHFQTWSYPARSKDTFLPSWCHQNWCCLSSNYLACTFSERKQNLELCKNTT